MGKLRHRGASACEQSGLEPRPNPTQVLQDDLLSPQLAKCARGEQERDQEVQTCSVSRWLPQGGGALTVKARGTKESRGCLRLFVHSTRVS